MKRNLLLILIPLFFVLGLVACNEQEIGKDEINTKETSKNKEAEKNDKNLENETSKVKRKEVLVGDVNQFMDIILEHEGEYSNHQSDLGGVTKYGITEQSWEAKKSSFHSTKSISEIDEADARKFYEDYWNSTAIPFSKMTPSLSLVMVDTTVLFWEGSDETGGSALFFQQAVNNLGIFDKIYNKFSNKKRKSCDLTIDKLENGKLPENGGWGNQSKCIFDKIKVEDQKEIAEEILDLRENFHNKTVKESESQKVFDEGWKNRVNSLREIIKTMQY